MEAMEVEFGKQFGGVFVGRSVLVTGHTGFKGSWLSLWLALLGARVTGYALPGECPDGNFGLCRLRDILTDIRGDIRDKEQLKEAFHSCKPDVVFHLAAQPIVRDSYQFPVETLETNVMGTVNVLENVRRSDTVAAGLIVTSDKCYENREQIWGYREGDALGGFDPYSASKGCAELVTAAYQRSFFTSGESSADKAVSTARAGNVLGGGDWAAHRIVPDCVRALKAGRPIDVRNPRAVRPWQFVLEPLYGYLLLASSMLRSPGEFTGAWNFGPDFESAVPVGTVVDKVVRLWGSGEWADRSGGDAPHEAGLLSLDCTKAKALLGWKPRLSLDEALDWTLAWYRSYDAADMAAFCTHQITDYSARCAAEQ